MTSSFVGAAWQGSFPKSYWSHFDLLELPNDKVSTLKLKTVKSWLANGPDARLLVVPIEVEDVVDHPARILSERAQQFLGLSSPSILRVRTSASLRPSQRIGRFSMTFLNGFESKAFKSHGSRGDYGQPKMRQPTRVGLRCVSLWIPSMTTRLRT